MQRRKFFLMAAATLAAATGALAEPPHGGPGGPGGHGGPGGPGGDHHDGHDDWRGRDAWHWRDERGGWHSDHDRYWRSSYGKRRYVGRDRVFLELRRRHYTRFVGDPYWYQGRYVVRAYDRSGSVVMVEVDPYTAGFLGVIRF